MKRAAVVLWGVSCLLAFALSLGAQGRGAGGKPSPVRAIGPGPVAMAARAERNVAQYPSSTAQGYRGVVAADVNMLNDATNIDELVVDFGVDGVWVMEGYSIYYENTWNQITSANPDWIISAEFDGRGGRVRGLRFRRPRSLEMDIRRVPGKLGPAHRRRRGIGVRRR